VEKPNKSRDLVEFTAEFVRQARKCIKESAGLRKTTFTSRQSLAIAALGIAKLLRTHVELGVNDLVSLAVTTSPPEAQKYAEMIALRILLGDERELFNPAQPATGEAGDGEETVPDLVGTSLLLQEILEFLSMNQSVDMNKGMKELAFANEAENELYGQDSSTINELSTEARLDRATKRVAHEIVNGREGIVQNQITTWESLFDQAKREILKSVPFMDKQALIASQMLGCSNDVQHTNREPYVQSMARLLQAITGKEDDDGGAGSIQDIIGSLSHRQLSSAMDTLQQYKSRLQQAGLRPEELAPRLDETIDGIGESLRSQASTLDDILAHPGLFADKMGNEEIEALVRNSLECNEPLDVLDDAKQVDDMFGTNASATAYDTFKEKYDRLSIDDLAKHPIASSEWLDALDNKMDDAWDDWKNVFNRGQQLVHAKQQLANPFISDVIDRDMQQGIDDLLPKADTPEDLEHLVDFTRENGYKFSTKDVMSRGSELGMSKEDIMRLIGSVFEYLKEMVEGENPSFERFSSMMERASLSGEQVGKLITLAVQHAASGALGALASTNMMSVAQAIPNTDEGAELFAQALGAGGGENLLDQWFMQGKRLPPFLRQIAKDAAKRVLIDIAKARSSSLIGSSEAGPLPEGTTRPYFIGDDPEAIDLDESIDNVIQLGKQLDDIRLDDFIVRKEVTGRRCVVFLVDISGSMQGPPLAAASIACAMLLLTFGRDELGVALFESNTHVICEIDQDIDIDELVDEILDLEARGGTQMQAALAWAEDQLTLSRSEDKMFVMLTDAMIGDYERSREHMQNIADQDATAVLIVPEVTFGVGNIQSIVESTNAQLVTIGNWRKFPETVSRILSRA